MATDYSNLLPSLKEWDGTVDIVQWIGATGDYEKAIAYAALYWPEFYEYQGCVFWKPVDEASYSDWHTQVKGDKSAIEATINHLHMIDLFPNVSVPPTIHQMAHLGRKLKSMWEAKLELDYPSRSIVVVLSEGDQKHPEDYAITMFSSANSGGDK